MCARYAFFSGKVVNDVAGVAPLPDLEPSWNIAPGQWAPVIAVMDGRRLMIPMEWGLLPPWLDRTKMKPFINVRAETAGEKPSFKASFRRRRCLIPLDGWFEWQGDKGAKQPWYFHSRSGEPLVMAGLWEEVDGRQTFAVLTRPAAPALSVIHERMPAILEGADAEEWLSFDEWAGGRVPLLFGTDEGLAWHKVGKEVGRPTAQGPHLIEPL